MPPPTSNRKVAQLPSQRIAGPDVSRGGLWARGQEFPSVPSCVCRHPRPRPTAAKHFAGNTLSLEPFAMKGLCRALNGRSSQPGASPMSLLAWRPLIARDSNLRQWWEPCGRRRKLLPLAFGPPPPIPPGPAVLWFCS